MYNSPGTLGSQLCLSRDQLGHPGHSLRRKAGTGKVLEHTPKDLRLGPGTSRQAYGS